MIILDGLYGGCFELYEKLNAKKKVIYTGDVDIHREVKARGWESHLRSEGISSLIE